MKCPLDLWVLCCVYKQGVQTFRFKTMNSAMIFGLLTLVVLYSVSGEKTTEQIEVRHMTDSSSKKNMSKMFPLTCYITVSVSVYLSTKSRDNFRSIYIFWCDVKSRAILHNTVSYTYFWSKNYALKIYAYLI